MQSNERTDERVAQDLRLYSCLFQATVHCGPEQQESRRNYWAIRLFACSLAPLTHLLAPHCLLRSRAPLRSFVHSLAYSLNAELVGKWMSGCLSNRLFCTKVRCLQVIRLR